MIFSCGLHVDGHHQTNLATTTVATISPRLLTLTERTHRVEAVVIVPNHMSSAMDACSLCTNNFFFLFFRARIISTTCTTRVTDTLSCIRKHTNTGGCVQADATSTAGTAGTAAELQRLCVYTGPGLPLEDIKRHWSSRSSQQQGGGGSWEMLVCLTTCLLLVVLCTARLVGDAHLSDGVL